MNDETTKIERKCEWLFEIDPYGCTEYKTSCNNYYNGSHNFRYCPYCPYCGGKIDNET